MAKADTPGAILEWLSSAEGSKIRGDVAASPQSQEAQNFRVLLCSTYIPKLTTGVENLKQLGMDNDRFAVQLKECTELLEKLGGPLEVSAPQPSTAQDSFVLNLLKSPLPTTVKECKSLYIQLRSVVEQTGLADITEAEACIRIMQHLQPQLADGSQKCIAVGCEDEYKALAEDCRVTCTGLEGQVADFKSRQQPAEEFKWEWKPYKLIDSVLDRHTNLIRCVDRLHDDFGAEFQDLNLKFPEIVVVGTESVGKSSVMEKLAGLPIFPRGEGVTTRKSFRLRLHHLTDAEMAQRKATLPAGQQPTMVNKTEVLMKFEDASEYVLDHEQVRKRVQQANQEVADKGWGVDKGEIVLNMYSTVFPDLTLLDMPGLIRARGERDPQDIVHKCEELVREKIGHEDAIVLAVLNARANSVRGTAEGIRIVQQLNAESRTLAVLTCVDRTDAEDEVPAVMRQTKGLELPSLGYHYHAVIGRDVKRTASGNRAEKTHCERFEQAVRDKDLAKASEYLEQNLVSEESLTSAVQLAAVADAVALGTEELGRRVREKLEETRREQDRFEDRYFEPLQQGGEMTPWQKEKRVDGQLLAADLTDFLGSSKLGCRLSEMLENHIRISWAPKMSDAVRRKEIECQKAKKMCGVPPPEGDGSAMASQLVQRFLLLFAARHATLSASVLAPINAHRNCPRPPRLASSSSGHTVLPDTWSPPPSSSPTRVADAAAAAVEVIREAKHKVAAVALSCLGDEEPDLCLQRFPVFREWMQAVLSQLLEAKRGEAEAWFESFLALLDPEARLPTLDKGQHETRVIMQMGEVLPRMLHKHFVTQVLAELPGMLRNVPNGALYAGKPLLTEESKNAATRRKIERQLRALSAVRNELRTYDRDTPHEFLCPISLDVMLDPVVAPDGRSYERFYIEEWIAREGGTRSPLGHADWGPKPQLNPNRTLKEQILEWKTTPVKKKPLRKAR